MPSDYLSHSNDFDIYENLCPSTICIKVCFSAAVIAVCVQLLIAIVLGIVLEHRMRPAGSEVIKLEYSLKLKIKSNDWLHMSASSQSLRFILSLRMNLFL